MVKNQLPTEQFTYIRSSGLYAQKCLIKYFYSFITMHFILINFEFVFFSSKYKLYQNTLVLFVVHQFYTYYLQSIDGLSTNISRHKEIMFSCYIDYIQTKCKF